METLLIDYGHNCYKVGKDPSSIYRVYNLVDNILEFSAKCNQLGNNLQINKLATKKLSQILSFNKPEIPKSFFVSQHMDYELKKDNFIRKTFELYFEKYGFEKGQTWLQPLLAFYASRGSGPRNALLVDSGEESTYFIPFYDDFILKDSIERSPLAGATVSRHFKSFLSRKGCSSISDLSEFDFKQLKQNALEVCPNFKLHSDKILNRENFYWRDLKLPDGNKIILKKEVFEIPELLFNPSDFGLGGQGLADKMFSAIKVV